MRADFSAINYAATGKWEVHADTRGVQQVNALTVERLTGAEALLQLVTDTQNGASSPEAPSTEIPARPTARPRRSRRCR